VKKKIFAKMLLRKVASFDFKLLCLSTVTNYNTLKHLVFPLHSDVFILLIFGIIFF